VHADIPHQEVVFLDETDPMSSPMKAKGVGELGICGSRAAVANAIYNATGVPLREVSKPRARSAPFGEQKKTRLRVSLKVSCRRATPGQQVLAKGGAGTRKPAQDPTSKPQSNPFFSRNLAINSAICRLLRSEKGKCVFPRMPNSGR
jgi:hypothetical protein